MKVLNIMTSNLHYNGIGMSLLNYYNYINYNEIQMDYLVPNKVDIKLKNEFTKKGNKLFELDYYGKKMHQRNPILYCIKLYKILKKEKYDIVHAHGSSSMLFLQLMTAKFAGIKIRIAHSRNTDTPHKLLHYIFKPLFNLLYTDAFACGKEAGEWLFGKNKNFTIIPNGKDTNMFCFKSDKRKEYRKKYKLEDKIVLGNIGNLNYQKNHDFLIDIFNELYKKNKNYYLVIVGKGDLEEKIKEKVKSLGLEKGVLFLGQISVQDVSNLLNAIDIMVFPSHFEGFPNVLIEWQMNGLPCIISDRITKDVKITNLVHFVSINSVEPWIFKITNLNLVNRENDNKILLNQIKKAGYDISENSKMLERKYSELYKEHYNINNIESKLK